MNVNLIEVNLCAVKVGLELVYINVFEHLGDSSKLKCYKNDHS